MESEKEDLGGFTAQLRERGCKETMARLTVLIKKGSKKLTDEEWEEKFHLWAKLERSLD